MRHPVPCGGKRKIFIMLFLIVLLLIGKTRLQRHVGVFKAAHVRGNR